MASIVRMALVIAVVGCAAHAPVRAQLGPAQSTAVLESQATPGEQNVVEIVAPIAADDWCSLEIAILYPRQSVLHAIDARLQDAAGARLDQGADIECRQGIEYPHGGSGVPGCTMTLMEIQMEDGRPRQPINLFVRSRTGRDIPIEVTLGYGPGEKIRVREGPMIAPDRRLE